MDIRNKTILTNGFESRNNLTQSIKTRWNITRYFLLTTNFSQGKKENYSEFLSARDYRILYYEIEPMLNFQPNTAFRIGISYKLSDKKNTIGEGQEMAKQQKIGTEIKYNVVSKGSFTGNVNYIFINYNGAENSSLAFEMLEGLQAGQNMTWTVSYQRNLSENTQLSLTYEGRKSQNTKIIHTGGIQVRAYF